MTNVHMIIKEISTVVCNILSHFHPETSCYDSVVECNKHVHTELEKMFNDFKKQDISRSVVLKSITS